MKLLIITQVVDENDDVLGFAHGWLAEFARNVEELTVICLKEGSHSLPANVKVLSLGKERGGSRLGYLVTFFRYLWLCRNSYTAVFVHMNPEYIAIAGWLWRLTGKRIALWYTHRQITLYLRQAVFWSHIVFTAAPESFRLPSKKVQVIGHGINVEAFHCESSSTQALTLLHVGRITEIKNCAVLIKALKCLHEQGLSEARVVFVGGPVKESDHTYLASLHSLVQELGLESAVAFVGSIPNRSIKDYYCQTTFSVNLTPTGGIDKAVLESMAAGRPCLVSNEGFRDYFGSYADRLIFVFRDPVGLADKIKALWEAEDQKQVADDLYRVVKKRGSVQTLIATIVSALRS